MCIPCASNGQPCAFHVHSHCQPGYRMIWWLCMRTLLTFWRAFGVLIVSKLFFNNIYMPSHVPLIDSKGCWHLCEIVMHLQHESSTNPAHIADIFGELFGVLIVFKLFFYIYYCHAMCLSLTARAVWIVMHLQHESHTNPAHLADILANFLQHICWPTNPPRRTHQKKTNPPRVFNAKSTTVHISKKVCL